MNHDNVTEQIGALAEDLQGTKESLLAKLEVNMQSIKYDWKTPCKNLAKLGDGLDESPTVMVGDKTW
jgi:hypothetical protein